MILRRPYAFLIKYFKLIHLILFGLFVYIIVKANNILSFFKSFITANGNIEVIPSNYISFSLFASIIIIIAISLVIYFLMKYKKKPRFLYILIVIINIVAMILFIYLYGNIKTLELTSMSAKTIRLLRDISRFNYWLLFLTSIPILIRGLGFDIKKFNFSKDLVDFQVDKEDNAEVEVNVDLTPTGALRTGRKVTRELKYYYAENKFFINIILGVIILILILVFPFNKFVIHRTLREGETLSTNYFNIRVNESYISERKRTSTNNSYVILKVSVKGKVSKYSLNLDQFVLKGKNNEYIPSLKYYYYFSDLGIGYKNNKLDTNEYQDYLLIYNIKNEDSNSKLVLNYLANNRKIKLSPEILK